MVSTYDWKSMRNRQLVHLVSVLAIGTITTATAIGCAPATQPRGATRPAATTQVAANPRATAAAIDAIIYSDLPAAQMLDRLKPYVQLMQTEDDFLARSGLQPAFAFGSGPGVMDETFDSCGIDLVIDPDKKIRIIRRSEGTHEGKSYPAMSISERGFTWNGYARWYPN